MSSQVSYSHAWRKAKSYLYILYWDRRYFTRVWSINKLIPFLLIGLSVFEVLGSLLHFVKWLDDTAENVRIGIAVVLFAAAVVMVWHHRRLEGRVERHQAIMAMTRVLCTRALDHYDHDDDDCCLEFVHNTLEGFIFALEHKRDMGVMNASLVVRDAPGQEFRILNQYPSGTFIPHTRLHPVESAAAITAAQENNTVVYIPSTKHVHGIKLEFEEDKNEFMPNNSPGATTTRIIENAFQPIDIIKEAEVLRSLLCVGVPNEVSANGRVLKRLGIQPGSEMVLCLGMHHPDRMGELDFNAIQVTAKLLAMGLKETL